MVIMISVWEIFLLIYGAINVCTFFAYACDKFTAQRNWRRIPEKTLLLAAFFGPWGAFAAMMLCHHKTKKTIFYLVPVFLFLHIVLFVLFITGLL